MSVGIFIYRNFVTTILLGDQWGEAAGFIGLWGLMSGLAIVFVYLAGEVFRSKGKPKISMISQSIHILFLIPTVLIGVNYGFSTLYTLRALVRIQGILTSIIFLCVLFKFKFSQMVTNLMPAVVSTLVMTAFGIMFVLISENILWQFTSILLCIIIYFSALFLLFPSARKEIFDLPIVKKIFHHRSLR